MKTEAARSGDFLLSEGNGVISREVVAIASGEGKLVAGTVLGQVTASKKFKACKSTAEDGSEVAAGILYHPVDATSADVNVLAVTRMAEVKEDYLTGSTEAIAAALAALNIIVR